MTLSATQQETARRIVFSTDWQKEYDTGMKKRVTQASQYHVASTAEELGNAIREFLQEKGIKAAVSSDNLNDTVLVRMENAVYQKHVVSALSTAKRL